MADGTKGQKMSGSIIGMIVTAGLSLIGLLLKWRFGKAREDRFKRVYSEQEAEGLKRLLKDVYKAKAKANDDVKKIVDGLSDAGIGEMLSSPPKPSKNPNPPRSRNGNRGGSKMRHH